VKAQLKRAGVLAVGWAFIVLGIIGLFLPILQGILFLLIGLVILSSEYVWAHQLLHKLRTRFPKIAEQMDRARERAERFMRKKPKAEGV
jgi:uncharacterized membrane protein YbaN (DUF454 family)